MGYSLGDYYYYYNRRSQDYLSLVKNYFRWAHDVNKPAIVIAISSDNLVSQAERQSDEQLYRSRSMKTHDFLFWFFGTSFFAPLRPVTDFFLGGIYYASHRKSEKEKREP